MAIQDCSYKFDLGPYGRYKRSRYNRILLYIDFNFNTYPPLNILYKYVCI